MRVLGILRKVFKKSNIPVHKARLSSVFFAVEALLHGGRLNCSGLGRSARSRVKPKHNIKRIDRLLGNTKLHSELRLFFKAITRAVIGRSARPIILIDWTKVEYGRFSAITATVPVDGRSLPILWHVYEDRNWASHEAHLHFLLTLATLLPSGCKPILVTDAGFHKPWFELVQQLEWDWVGRIGISKLKLPSSKNWLSRKEVFGMAKKQARDFGECEVGQIDPMVHRVVLGKRYRPDPYRSKGRRKRLVRSGCGVQKAKKRSKEPWILATSLHDKPVTEVDGIYALRMQIEECYRDTKNHRFGWSFEDARASTVNRHAVLLLVATLAMLVLFLIGLAMENQNRQYLFQANTVRHKRVLSLFFLGKQMILRPEMKELRINELHRTLRNLKNAVGNENV